MDNFLKKLYGFRKLTFSIIGLIGTLILTIGGVYDDTSAKLVIGLVIIGIGGNTLEKFTPTKDYENYNIKFEYRTPIFVLLSMIIGIVMSYFNWLTPLSVDSILWLAGLMASGGEIGKFADTIKKKLNVK